MEKHHDDRGRPDGVGQTVDVDDASRQTATRAGAPASLGDGDPAVRTTPEVAAIRASVDAPVARPQLRDLIGAYASVLSAADDLPLFVQVRTRHHRPRLLHPLPVIPRPRWLLRIFLIHHIASIVGALQRRYHLRAALEIADERDTADTAILEHLRQALPAIHTSRLVALMLFVVLVVSQLALSPTARILRGVNTSTSGSLGANGAAPVSPTSSAVGDRNLIVAALDRLDIEKVPELIEHALSLATFDINSSGRLIESVVSAGPWAFVALLGALALVIYLVLRPLVPSFRLKRMLFNLHPDIDDYLSRTTAPWHVTHSTGLYHLEVEAFRQIGQRSPPPEKPFDIGVLALPTGVLLVSTLAFAVIAGRWWSVFFVTPMAYAAGIAAAFAVAALLAGPFAVRLVWLVETLRRRRFANDGSGSTSEMTLPRSQAVVTLKNPRHFAAATGVSYAVVALYFLQPIKGTSVWEEIGVLLAWGLVLTTLALPWWYSVARELHDLGAVFEVPLGKWPSATAAILAASSALSAAMTVVAFTSLAPPRLPEYIISSFVLLIVVFAPVMAVLVRIARRIRHAHELAGTPNTLAPIWLLPAGMFASPLLFWHLQGQLNTVWRALGHPIAEAPPDSHPPAEHRAADSLSRRAIACVLALGILAFTAAVAVGVSPGPDRYGDDPALDALWNACADGSPRACEDLYLTSPLRSKYEEFAETRMAQITSAPIPAHRPVAQAELPRRSAHRERLTQPAGAISNVRRK